METQVELPLYLCHKQVRALKIAHIEYKDLGQLWITPVDERFCGFAAEGTDRPKPEVGWYFVQYDNGYTSFSPAQAFEDGYTLASEPQ